MKKSNIQNTAWKTGTTKNGNTRHYRLLSGEWVNVIVYGTKLYITYDSKTIPNKIMYDPAKLPEVLNQVYITVLEHVSKEPKAWEDMKPHEQLVEIGKRENIKFGDGHQILP